MKIFIGADHRGFELKEQLKEWLISLGQRVVDQGNDHYDPDDDFPDFAISVAKKLLTVDSSRSTDAKGILICGSAGMTVLANKFKGIRAAEVWDEERARHAKAHDHTNVIQLPADFVDLETAKKIVQTWLETPEDQAPRLLRRLRKITEIEKLNFK